MKPYLRPIDPCCSHPEHSRPWRNENGWVLTGTVDDSDTWEAWTAEEWATHCAHAAYERAASKRKRRKAA